MDQQTVSGLNVVAHGKYIARNYLGIQSVEAMQRVNEETLREAEKLMRRGRHVRILLDLSVGSYTSMDIYLEAIKILDMIPIYKIALLYSDNQMVRFLTRNTESMYERLIEYGEFDDLQSAVRWLNAD